MRDLHKILKLFDEEYAMDYYEDFDAIKSVLDFCNENVKSLNKVRFRGGNDDVIDEICKRLQEYFLRMDYIDPESKKPLLKATQKFRKMAMFLFVNTDATYKYNLRDDPALGHIVEICPLLTKFLLVAIIWNLNMEQYFCEALSYCPSWFSFQYFETASDSLKHINDPYEVLVKVEQLVRAIFTSITNTKTQHANFVDTKIILSKLYDYTMNLLRQFYTPDAEKFKSFTKNQFFKYSGYAINHLLDMILFTFDVYEEKQPLKPEFDTAVYEIFGALSKSNQPSSTDAQPLIKEFQLKVITALLNSLQYNVMLVKIDVFMYWVEIDLNDRETLQSVIGVKSYLVGERMLARTEFRHDVELPLLSIAIRPKSLEELIRDATIGEILCKLDEQLERHEKKAWFNELLNRTVALGNDECLQSIRANAKLICVENCLQLIHYIELQQLHWDNNIDDEESNDDSMDMDSLTDLRRVILLALDNLNAQQIIELIAYEVRNFGTRVTRFQDDHFAERATEFLNKFAASFDMHAFFALCFENPFTMWTKMFDVACNSEEHIENFCTVVKLARPLSNEYFYPLLDSAFTDDRLEQKYFPQLLCSIYFELYSDRKTEFFKKFINTNVNEMLEMGRYSGLLSIVKCLNLITVRPNKGMLNFGEATAPVLLMAAQIMENTRWDLLTYSDVRDEIVRGCATFIQNTSKKFLPLATEKDKKWINKTIKDSYRPLTQYYFQKFALNPDQPAKKFDEFLIPTEIENASDAEMFLISNFIRCTTKETEWLARSDRLLPHMSDMMLTLGVVVNETENSNAILNYRNCMVNYANIVKKYLLPEIVQNTIKIEQLMVKLLKIIEFAPATIYDEMFMSFEGLLLQTMQQCSVPVDDNVVQNVRKNVTKMKECRGKEVFLQNFETLVMEKLS